MYDFVSILRAAHRIPDPWRARKIRIFRNGDRFFPGIEYTFRIGRDVLNMESLCDKISNRIGKDILINFESLLKQIPSPHLTSFIYL